MNVFEKLLSDINQSTFQDLVNMAGPEIEPLMNTACPIFERYHPAQQSIAMAFMLGMLLAAIEGLPCDIERQGVLMNKETRLKLFLAQVEVAYREATVAAQHPDAPRLPGAKVM